VGYLDIARHIGGRPLGLLAVAFRTPLLPPVMMIRISADRT
jgi:hypothetical protein